MPGAIAKPQLRGLLHKQIGRHLAIGITLAISAGLAQKFLLNEPRKATYANFYKTYNVDKEFEEIRKKGLFDSAK